MRKRMKTPPDTGLGSDHPQLPGDTSTAQGEDQTGRPRMPHERDESADSQASMEPSGRHLADLGRRDVERGVVDTTRGAELDATYDRQREDLPDRRKQFRP